MAIQVIHRDDVDQQAGLLINADNKLQVQVDGTSVVINAAGQLTSVAEVEIKLSDVAFNPTTNELTFTLSDGTVVPAVSLADLVDVDTNTYVKSGAVDVAAKELNLTMSDDTVVTVNLAPVTEAILTTANAATDAKINAVRGDELQSLGGVSLGYLMTAPTAP